MSPRPWITALVVIASTTSVRFAYADGKNEIRAVTFDEAGGAGATNVHVRGADAPTFTVYKLERPARVVIDMPQARLADVLKGHESAATFAPNTWAVSTIAAQPMDDNGVRVIVTLARPGRYDVKTVGNEVVVMVSPRDAAPKNASPEELARAQQQASAAETARAAATQQAAAATAAASQSRAEADAAKAEAERLRKTAADQLARAEAAQRAVDQAKHASAADLDAAKATATKAKQDADAAKAAAVMAANEAERTRKAADKAKQDALAEAASAKADAARAHDDANRAQAEAATAKAEAGAAGKKTAEAEMALARAQAEAVAAKQEAAKQRAVAEQARRDADRTNTEAANAKTDAAKRAAELAAMKSEAAARSAEAASAKSEVAKRTAEAEAAKTDAAKRAAELDAVMREANSAKTTSQQQVAAARTEAANAKAEAARARSEAETARVEAAADKKKAEAARGDAEKMLKDAKTQLSSLDQKMTAAQALDDKARATNAAAQAREEAARDVEAKAKQDRAAAELAAKQAQDAQTKVAASQRARAAADAKAADDRLADARRATAAAEQQRRDAETAALSAKKELDQSRTALASVEQQRTEATSLATAAAKKRSDAEAAASDATRRRGEAETAAADAAKQKKAAELAASDAMQKKSQAERDRAEAEAQRVAALDAAKSAQQARDAAEKQRKIAEKAADTAVAAKASAETSLGTLTAKRQAAERAAADLEARSKAEAKAQAEIVAAQTRKASDDEVAKAKTELAKLAADRKQAEGELADRRKAVALQQAEATRLETVATQAHDAANREETRRAELAQKRTAEETALAAAKAEAEQVKAQVAAKPVAAPKQEAAKPAPKQVADAKPTKVTAIDFKGDETAGQVTIAVGDDANVQIGEITANHAELIVDNAELAQKLERKLDVSKLGSPVRAVSSFRDRQKPNRVRLIAELTSPATPTVDRDGGTVRWHFTSVEAVAKRPVKVTNVPSPVVGGFGAASTPVAQQTVTQLPPQGQRRRVYHGATIDLDIRDAPIHDLLRLLSETGHVNIVIPDTVTPKVTVKLKRVPWDQALEVILQSNGLWYRREGNLYRIATRKELDTEDQEEAARRDAALKAEAPRVERQGLNYASASELKPRLESMLSPHGRIEVDERTNALLINDVAANRAEIIRLALELDTQTPQISIEARIVEARSTFLRQIGVQWGGNAIAGAGGGNATGLIWPSNIAVTGANSDQQTISTGVAAPSDFAVNLPAATGAGEGGALGFSLGSIGGNFNINLRLSALEDTGTVRIISAPKITVLNNKEASISQGVSIPISVVSAAGTNTQFVQADLKLQVTPYVSQRDCAIAMNLVVQKNEPDFVNVGARGDPTILRKEAKTQMLVADGETTVLGGIYTRNAGVAYKKIPLFGDIPVLGWLFKNRRENDDRTEILVFITPKITNKGSLPCTK